MDAFPFWTLFVVVGLLIAVIVFVAAKRQLDAMNSAWQMAAERLGFDFAPGTIRGGPTISGNIDGHAAEIHSYTKSSGKNSSRYTRYSVAFHAIGIGLRLSRQSGFGQLLKVLGSQDIEIGDPTFDKAFIVQATDPRAARAFLTSGITMALNRLIAVQPHVVVMDDRIVIDHQASVRDAEVLVSTIRRLASAATVLADATESAALSELVDERLQGTVPEPHALAAESRTSVDSRLSVGEALMAAGTVDIAGRIFDALAGELPADVEVTGWSKHTRGRPDGRAAAPPPPAPLPPQPDARAGQRPPSARDPVAPDVTDEVDPDLDRDPLAVAIDLFGENRLSFETAERFGKTYEGRSVHWTGKVRSAKVVEHDRILGSGPYAKAIIDIASLENDLFGNTVVSAVVALPASALGDLTSGRTVTFTGSLIGIDALVRNLYVGGGRLV